MTNLTNNKAVLSWIDEMTAITKPDKIVWITGEEEQLDALREQHGVSIEKNRIVQAEPIKSFGSFEVKCKFGYGIDGTVQLLVIEK